jgi:hypothetical protein
VAVIQLATSVDVEEVLGRNLTSLEMGRVNAILDKASELFRLHSGQKFTSGDSVQRLKVNGGRVRLPQRPVTAIVSVVDDDGSAVDFSRLDSVLTVDMQSSQFLTVSYSHGGEVPDLVRLCVADVAKSVLSISAKAAEGITQYSETTGPFNKSETYASWAVGGSTRLTPDDRAFAETFKVKYGSVIVQSL